MTTDEKENEPDESTASGGVWDAITAVGW